MIIQKTAKDNSRPSSFYVFGPDNQRLNWRDRADIEIVISYLAAQVESEELEKLKED